MKHHLGFVYGLSPLIFISLISLAISHFIIPFLSPLIIGILLGAMLSCIYPKLAQTYNLQPSMGFASKKLLRLGIIFYGSYITLNEIATLGLNGLLIAILVVAVIFVSAIFIGRLLKLDRDISLLVGIGSAVCGAAAISPESQNVAIIVKMTRVVLLVPLLLIVSYILFKQNIAHIKTQNKNSKPYIPYFAFAFLGVIMLNSIVDWQNTAPLVIESAQMASRFFLIIAIVAIGLQINWQKFVS